jgi:protein-tyrosine phosphatase
MQAGPAPATLVDLHSHVLPDLDDGAEDTAMALAMLRLSAERGVTAIVATPHSQIVANHGGLGEFNDRFGRTRALLDEHSIPIELLRGMEVRLLPDVPDLLSTGAYLTLNDTKTVLVEFDYTQWATYSEEVLFNIAVRGYAPLLAHVERIVPLQEQPERVRHFVEIGYHTQITAMSLLGGFGREAEETARTLLGWGVVHTVASDMHRANGNRQPMPAATLGRLTEMVGEEAAHLLLYANPVAIVRGEPVAPVEPKPTKRRRWGFLPF